MVNKGRDKELDRDATEKKHRKTSSTNSNDIPPTKIPKEDVYVSAVKFEEEESKKRMTSKDSTLFLETCDKIKKIFVDIVTLKNKNSDAAQQEIDEKRIDGSFLIALLKKLNRLDKVRLRAGRDALHKEKLIVDSNKLQLQNLLYEADHLRKEVQHCLQFKSQDEEIDLVSENDFYKEAPDHITRRSKTENDEHARRLARLEWELQQRKELSIMCKELQEAKEKVAQEIESKTTRLNSLIPCLDALLKATRPLQDALEINVEKEWAVQKIASLLPRPLYLVYANFGAYSETCDKFINVTINGDEDEARELDNSERVNTHVTDVASQDSDNEDNDQENDGECSKNKHHHRRQSSVVATEVNVFKAHPLSVTFKLTIPSKEASLSITLYYLPSLGFISVQTQLADIVVNGIASRDVLDPKNILDCLDSDDSIENEILHPKTTYTLQQLSMDANDFLAKLDEEHLGKPYKWAQNLCGLSFTPYGKCVTTNINYELTQTTVPNIVKKIRERLQSRLLLYKQILALEQKNINDLIMPIDSLASVRTSCTLVQWCTITWAEYTKHHIATGKFIDANYVTLNHLLYSAVMIRGAAKLDCFVSISPHFGKRSPLWAISLNWNGTQNASNNADIREMEYWINSVEISKRNISCILGLQLKRTMHSMDIYLETESAANPEVAEFKSEKTFFKGFRGRTHSRPYKIVKNGGSVIYSQI